MSPQKIVVRESDLSDMTLMGYLSQQTDFLRVVSDFEEKYKHQFPPYLSHHLDIKVVQALAQYVENKGREIGWFPFTYGGQPVEANDYESIALTYNPFQVDAPSENPHQGTLGSQKFLSGINKHYQGMERKNFKNTYSDSFAFHYLTPIAQEGVLGAFLKSCKRTLIRSRISRLRARPRVQHPDFCWHNDESIFVNFRINIPLVSSPNYVIELIQEPGNTDSVLRFPLIPGFYYAYDTHLFHRPTCLELDNSYRINMICGVSPWVDYNWQERQWETNEFYGVMHPFDMLKEGHIFPQDIKLE